MAFTETANSGILFIPDISGFTRFINESEIDHSRHIIQELLEIIIDANELKMELNEIEGDAVLFYRHGSLPSLQEIIQQSERMFVQFHEHLLRYERDRICECGACSTANGLSLKILVHAGEIQTMQIRDHKKLIGSDIILTHRLLKNSIDGSEYLLLTDQYLNNQEFDPASLEGDWSKLQQGVESYGELGEVAYKFVSMNFLLEKVELKPRSKVEKSKNKISVSVDIHAPIQKVHHALTDLDSKMKISKDIKEVKYDKDKIPRVGTVHQCILPAISLEIETTDNQVDSGTRLYAEKIHNFPIFKKANFVYTMMDSDDEKTNLKLDLYIPDKNFFSNLKFKIMQFLLRKQITKNIHSLKMFAETD